MKNITDSQFVDNKAIGGDGGAIYAAATTLTVGRTVFHKNVAGTKGGAIYAASTAPLHLSNTTISGNRAETADGQTSTNQGGGIYYAGTGVMTIVNSTIADNTAYLGAGLRTTQPNATIHNTIVATNTASTPARGDDVYGTLQSTSAHNLIGIDTGMTGPTNGSSGNKIGTQTTPLDPKLGTLRDNGGLTLTHALLPSSPAFDAGNNLLAVDVTGNPLLTDQRGYARVYGMSVDIGAFEVNQSYVGLYFDTDNYTDGYPSFGARVMPERSEREEYYKTSPYGLGKVMIPNWGDSDGDGILDCWDGYRIGAYDQTALGNGARSELFYPIVVEIPDYLDLSEMKFQVQYNFGSTTPTAGTNNPPRLGDGNIRIWKKNGPEA